MHKRIEIETDMIQLGQFLQLANVIESGGMAKWFLSEFPVFVNGEEETRRGKKLGVGDVVEIEGEGSYTVVKEE
ncbi:S4 domain-containing protein YaaA [Pontibacillus yanchengensis]|uniref:S4 domain-containing protein YaaA n=2 Tax=Pontibacillus yanchengensis TaxID=462910 RepID=A0ACC7VHJ2_9BACI|nr:S4 domain-containing protein YaaA [Pontibacillus yanchengensis]MYL34429.1 S4 domain-containing protein YaaA [Pontibacillus yanchengensis]MYL54237.1 S4 domain-containing protein YaaA [Pontibacillus yanchengensis]